MKIPSASRHACKSPAPALIESRPELSSASLRAVSGDSFVCASGSPELVRIPARAVPGGQMLSQRVLSDARRTVDGTR